MSTPRAPRRCPLGVPWVVWIATACGRAASAAKEVALAMLFGASPFKDALVVAWAAPTLLAAYCNETFPALLTPRWAAGRRVGSTLPLLAVSALALLAAGVELFPRAAVLALAPAFAGARLALAVRLERWLAPAIVLLGAETMLAARLNALRRFVWSPLGAGLPAAGALLALAGSGGLPAGTRLERVAAGLTLGAALAVVILALAALRTRAVSPGAVTAAIAGPFPGPGAVPPHTTRALLSLLAAMALLNLIPWAEQAAASTLAPGAVAAFDYGDRLVLFAFGLSVAPYTSVCFTHLSECPPADFARHLEAGLRRLLAMTIPLALLLALGSRFITRWVYGWGAFNPAALSSTAPVVAVLGAALPLDAVVYFLLFALYAREQASTKLPLAAVLAACNVPLAFLGAAWGGLIGIAAAHVVGYAAGLAWLAQRRERILPGMDWSRALRVFGPAPEPARELTPEPTPEMTA